MVESFYFCFAEFQALRKGFPRFPKLCWQPFQITIHNHAIFDFFKKTQTKILHQQKQKVDVFLWKVQLSSVCSVSSVSSLRGLNTVSLTALRAQRNFTEAILSSRIKDRRDLCIFPFRFSFGVSSTRTKSKERSISKNRLICHHYKVSTRVLRNKSVLRQGAYLHPTPVIPAFFFSVFLLEFLLREQKATKDQFLRTAWYATIIKSLPGFYETNRFCDKVHTFIQLQWSLHFSFPFFFWSFF